MAWLHYIRISVTRSFRRVLSLARSSLLAIVVTAIGVFLIVVSFGVLRPGSFNNPLLTTTLNAATESFSFRTPGTRESAWSLPPGEFSILGTSDSPECDSNFLETVCRYSDNTRLVVDGSADVVMQMDPVGGWSLSVAETESKPASITLFDARGKELLQSAQLLQYHATNPETAIRFPFVADSAVLGADLHQTSTIDGTPYDFWQPVLLSGDVLMIADNRPSRETYKVLEERLDPGDVVQVGDNKSASPESGQSSVWGMVTVASGDAGSSVGTTVFQVVLHSSFREVSVRRFGAPEGHVIRASYWTIRQKWPNGQSAWVFFISVVLVLTFVLELRSSLSSCPAETDTGWQPPEKPNR